MILIKCLIYARNSLIKVCFNEWQQHNCQEFLLIKEKSNTWNDIETNSEDIQMQLKVIIFQVMRRKAIEKYNIGNAVIHSVVL